MAVLHFLRTVDPNRFCIPGEVILSMADNYACERAHEETGITLLRAVCDAALQSLIDAELAGKQVDFITEVQDDSNQ